VSTSSTLVCEHLLVSITDTVEVMSHSIYVDNLDIIDRSSHWILCMFAICFKLWTTMDWVF